MRRGGGAQIQAVGVNPFSRILTRLDFQEGRPCLHIVYVDGVA